MHKSRRDTTKKTGPTAPEETFTTASRPEGILKQRLATISDVKGWGKENDTGKLRGAAKNPENPFEVAKEAISQIVSCSVEPILKSLELKRIAENPGTPEEVGMEVVRVLFENPEKTDARKALTYLDYNGCTALVIEAAKLALEALQGKTEYIPPEKKSPKVHVIPDTVETNAPPTLGPDSTVQVSPDDDDLFDIGWPTSGRTNTVAQAASRLKSFTSETDSGEISQNIRILKGNSAIDELASVAGESKVLQVVEAAINALKELKATEALTRLEEHDIITVKKLASRALAGLKGGKE
ncbi:MAG: hypothetical protein ABIG39_07760 [Candidatus Micrarchaeota archaeon]